MPPSSFLVQQVLLTRFSTWQILRVLGLPARKQDDTIKGLRVWKWYRPRDETVSASWVCTQETANQPQDLVTWDANVFKQTRLGQNGPGAGRDQFGRHQASEKATRRVFVRSGPCSYFHPQRNIGGVRHEDDLNNTGTPQTFSMLPYRSKEPLDTSSASNYGATKCSRMRTIGTLGSYLEVVGLSFPVRW